jgi:hypothetical protein
VALYASLKRFQRVYGPKSLEFAAYLPFYASCNTIYREDEQVRDRPIRLFHGAADDYVSVEPCRKYVERLLRAESKHATERSWPCGRERRPMWNCTLRPM